MVKYLSVDQVAEALSIGRSTAYLLFRRPDFPAIKLGHRLLVSENALESWLAAGGTGGEPLNPGK